MSSLFLLRLYALCWSMQALYGTQIQKKLAKDLESVQNFALRICSHPWNLSYPELREVFNLPTLSSRREYLGILALYKIVFGLFYFPPLVLIPTSAHHNTRQASNNRNQFVVPFARTLSFKSSFLVKSLHTWNNLSQYSNVSLNEFKHILRNLFLL